ncbi:hypothetical protein D3C85_1301970 [compost metagenome]
MLRLDRLVTVVVTTELIAGLAGSPGVRTAVFTIDPAKVGFTLPLMFTKILPFAGTFAVSSTLFIAPVAPLLIVAPPASVVVHETPVICAATISLSATPTASDGPVLRTVSV